MLRRIYCNFGPTAYRNFSVSFALQRKSHLPDLQLTDRPIHEILTEQIIKNGDATAMTSASDRRCSRSFADVTHRASSLAAALHRDGRLQKNDVASVLLPNCVDYPSVYLGVWQRGGVCSPVNYVYTKNEMKHHLQDSGAKMVFTTPASLPKVTAAAAKLGGQIQRIIAVGEEAITVDGLSSTSADIVSLNEFIDGDPVLDLPYVPIEPKIDRALLPYSSGTTGPPKGVELSHYATNALLQCFQDRRLTRLPQNGEAFPSFLPMFHIYGMATMFAGLVQRATQVVMSHFDKRQFLQIIQDYKVRQLYAVPPVLVMLAKDPTVDEFDVSSLESVFVGAAPIGPDICDALLNRLPNIKFFMQGYGMTEIGISHAELPTPVGKIKPGSCGKLAANFECKIMDILTGTEVADGDRGELWIRSPGVMLGYLNRPEVTADTIDNDGWLHTDGSYYIVDRIKELIKVKGFQVAPAELESLLLSHDGVQDVAVIAVPDEKAGELPRAYIVRAAGSVALCEADIHTFVNEQVASYKQLKGGVEFVAAIPKAQSGKLLRRVLKDDYLASLST